MQKFKMGAASGGNLEGLERRLAGTLTRVRPSREVVQRLRGRIHFPDPSEIANRLRDWNTLVLVFSAVLSGMIALITIARAVYHVVGRRNAA